MKSKFYLLRTQAQNLRKNGKTYGEIIKLIGKNIPKSTLSDWCHDIYLTSDQKRKVDKLILENLEKGRVIAHILNKERRKKYLESIIVRNKYLSQLLNNKDTAKIALAVLYLGEGSKRTASSLMFGNSDPSIIGLFLKLLRFCYNVDESRLRCTLQCRADQNIKKLEIFWSKITKIPFKKFYKAQIDPRTIGKPSKKKNYKGVCRIDYFSAETFNDLMAIGKIISN